TQPFFYLSYQPGQPCTRADLPAVQTGKIGRPLGLFCWPRCLRFPNERFIERVRLPLVALAVAVFFSLDLQSSEMLPQCVAHQAGTIPLRPPSGLIGSV